MKSLSEYITEGRRLGELKGKRIGKIEVGSGNLVWNKPLKSVTINNIDEFDRYDAKELIKYLYDAQRLHIIFDYDKMHHVSLYMTIDERKGHTDVAEYVNKKLVSEDWFYTGVNNLLKYIKEITI